MRVSDDMYVNYLLHARCAAVGSADVSCSLKKSYISIHEPGIGYQLLFMFLGGFVWFGILLLLEYDVFPSPSPKAFDSPRREEDEDVAKERRRVEEGRADQDKVVIRDLTRVYKKKGTGKSGRFTAVDGLTLGIKPGECFGLLGVNGAGTCPLS